MELEHVEGAWKKRDYQLCLITTLIKFGDAVELYLPGIITQQVAVSLYSHFISVSKVKANQLWCPLRATETRIALTFSFFEISLWDLLNNTLVIYMNQISKYWEDTSKDKRLRLMRVSVARSGRHSWFAFSLPFNIYIYFLRVRLRIMPFLGKRPT